MYVFVQDCNGNPLMPTKRLGKVRHLLKEKRAVVIMREPFTIRLTKPLEHTYTQFCSMGVDTGSVYIGMSVTTAAQEFFAACLKIRSREVHDLLETRKENRCGRHYKKGYRQARFDNRKKKDGWLAPSIEHRILSHELFIKLVMKLLPVKKITLELGKFDTQKMKDPEISGSEYQHGEKEGYENTKAFVKARDKYECQICHNSKGKTLQVHHIIPKNNGGPNTPANLVCLCSSCHNKLHKGKLSLPEKFNANKKSVMFLRDAAAMNMISMKIYERIKTAYPNITVRYTYGYRTKFYRDQHNITKSHEHDARVISGNPTAKFASYLYEMAQQRRHNRQLEEHQPRRRKAVYKDGKIIKKAMPRKKRKELGYVRRPCREIKQIHGFTKRSIVLFEGKKYFITGLRENGFFSLKSCDKKESINSISYKKLKLLYRQTKSIYVENIRKL